MSKPNQDGLSSDSDITNTQAGSQTGGAQAGAGSAAQATGAQTGQAQGGAGATYQTAGASTISDIGQDEAYLINMKRLVAGELDLDAALRQVVATSAARLARNSEDFDGQLRSFALNAVAMGQTALQNAVALSNRVNNGSIDLDTRIKSNAVDSDGRRQDNAESHDKQLDAISVSERERTVRGGDAGDVIRWAGLSENPIYQDAISAAAASAAVKAIEAQKAR
jgi:hypothetical protein